MKVTIEAGKKLIKELSVISTSSDSFILTVGFKTKLEVEDVVEYSSFGEYEELTGVVAYTDEGSIDITLLESDIENILGIEKVEDTFNLDTDSYSYSIFYQIESSYIKWVFLKVKEEYYDDEVLYKL